MINKQSGQIMILTIVFSAAILIVIGSLVSYAGLQARAQKTAVSREQALNIAEAGLEKAIWRLNHEPGYSGESNTVYGTGVYNISITNLSGSTKQIKAEAYVPNAVNPKGKRVVQVTANIGTTNVGFNYGVQVGMGGLEMTNSAIIAGNVYANGNIVGSNSARIEGTAIAAGPTGQISGMDIDNNSASHSIENSNVGGFANHYDLRRTDVGGDVSVYSMQGPNCDISGNAFYTINNGCNISGNVTTPNQNVPADPAIIPFPITPGQIDSWEADAEDGGILATQVFTSGNHSLGPVKIVGDLTISGTTIMTITGTVWVTGSILFDNSAIIRLHPSYGSQSGVIMAGIEGDPTAGTITLQASSQVTGSGQAGSYLMLLSQKFGTATSAITTSNTAAANILYAADGLVTIANNNSINLKEITSAKIVVSNSSRITYETGLANSQFGGGPGGGWEIAKQTWQLLQ